jgi:hypothetical protein
MFRSVYKVLCFLGTILVFTYSTWLSVNPNSHPIPLGNEYVNLDRTAVIKLVSIIWLLTPPVALYLDCLFFCRAYDLVNLELIRHAHSLIRNLWLAFIGVLMILFGARTIFSFQIHSNDK